VDVDATLKTAVKGALDRAGCPFDEVVDLVLGRHGDQITRKDDGTFVGLDDAVSKYRSAHPGFFTRTDPARTVDFHDQSKKLGELENDVKAGVTSRQADWNNGVDFSDRSKTLEQLEHEYVQRARTGAVK